MHGRKVVNISRPLLTASKEQRMNQRLIYVPLPLYRTTDNVVLRFLVFRLLGLIAGPRFQPLGWLQLRQERKG